MWYPPDTRFTPNLLGEGRVPYFLGYQTTCHTGSGVVPHENDREMIVTYLSTNSTSSFNRAHLKRRIPVGLVRDVCARVYVGHIPRPSQKWKGGSGKWLAWKCTLQNVRNC